MTVNYQTGYAGIYVGLTVDELIEEIKDRLGQSDLVRYSGAKMVRALNHKQRDFASRTRCLRGTGLIPMRADIEGYALPKMCLPDGLERARFYDTSTTYSDLQLKTRDYMDDHYPGWRVESAGDPLIVVQGDWFGDVQKIQIYPKPDTDGETYATATDAGVVVGGGDLPTSANNITGQATGGSTTTLQDTAVDFTTMGLVEGMPVVKSYGATNPVTPGSEPIGYIDVIAANQITFTAVLTNSGQFDVGDSYEILRGEMGVLAAVSQPDEESYIFSSDWGVLADITVPANNLAIEFRRYPVDLTFVGENVSKQRPEIPWSWHPNLADGAAAEILMRDTDRDSRRDQALAQRLMVGYETGIVQCNQAGTMPIRLPAKFSVRNKR